MTHGNARSAPDTRSSATDAAEPRVTAVVTAYNHGPFIAEAVRSVLEQTYRPLEVVVVDDGSTDDTESVLRGFGSSIVFIRQANQGVAASRNRGIAAATGSLLAFLDGDDRWHATKIEQQVAAYTRFPASGLVACDAQQFSGAEVLQPSLFSREVPRDTITSADCYAAMLESNRVTTTTQVMVPRHVLDDVGVSDTAFPIASDYDLYLRIAAKYPLTFLPSVLADWRYLSSSASGPMELRQLRWQVDLLGVLRKQVRTAAPARRPLVERALQRRAQAFAEYAYYGPAAPSIQRMYLRRGLRSSGFNAVIGYYCLAALIPRTVRTVLAPALRRLLTRP